MQWFILVGLMSTTVSIDDAAFIYTNPVFDTQTECVEHVRRDAANIVQDLGMKHPRYRAESIHCVSEETVQQGFEDYTAKQDSFRMEDSI